MDAPLGWPRPLGPALSDHRAGEPIDPPADTLFHRETDGVVHRTVGKRPMEVGADRIARTARSAVELIGELRNAGRARGMDQHPPAPRSMASLTTNDRSRSSIHRPYTASEVHAMGENRAGRSMVPR